MWNLFIIHNKDIKKRTWQIQYVHSRLEKHLKKVLDKLQVVDEEMQSLLLTFKSFLTSRKYLFAAWVRFFEDSKNSTGYSIPSPANKYILQF